MNNPTAKTKRIRPSQYDLFDALVLAALAALFAPTFHKLAVLGWKAADYTHAYFIAPISFWLVFQKRNLLIKSQDTPAGAVLFFAAGLLLYIFAAVNAFMFLEAFSFVLVTAAVFKIKLTGESFKKIHFPLAYLLFLVPPPGLLIDTVTLPLKKISTAGSYFLLKGVHLPVSVQGAILKVGNYDFFVADACSGFRSIVTLMALGSLYAYAQKTSVARKWVIFLSVIPLGLMGNVLRIFMTGCLAHFVSIRYAEGFFHEFSGGVLFLFAVFGLIWVSDKVCGKQNVR